MSNHHKILIVEDDLDSLLGLNVFLKKKGYSVLNAEDAAQAIEVAVASKPDLIILDLGLPAGGGAFVLEKVRNNLELLTTPVIILSAQPAEFSEWMIEKFGVSSYLEKPAGNDELLHAVERALDEIAVEDA